MSVPSSAVKTILVTGATGKQGGAAVRHLRGKGWSVRALTRDPAKPAARALSAAGVEVVAGNLDDRASLEPALAGVDGVFCALTPFQEGPAGEVRQGRNVGDAAKAAGVRQFVYSSVGGAERRTGIPHFDSKWQIEEHLRGLGLPLFVIRPVFFMDNFATPGSLGAIRAGTLRLPLRPDRPLQMVAVDDIGAFAALAFERPAEFVGRAIELAGDELTMPQVAEALGRTIGRPVRFEPQPLSEVEAFSTDLARMYRWFDVDGYHADIPALRAMYPPLATFADWLAQGGLGQAERAA